MIFICYTHKDKQVIDVIAQRLSSVFGRENIFHDAWSIQPEDRIIDKMDKVFGNYLSNNADKIQAKRSLPVVFELLVPASFKRRKSDSNER